MTPVIVPSLDQSIASRACLSMTILHRREKRFIALIYSSMVSYNWMPEIKLPRIPIIPTNSIQSNLFTKYSCATFEIERSVAPRRTRTSPRAGFDARENTVNTAETNVSTLKHTCSRCSGSFNISKHQSNNSNNTDDHTHVVNESVSNFKEKPW